MVGACEAHKENNKPITIIKGGEEEESELEPSPRCVLEIPISGPYSPSSSLSGDYDSSTISPLSSSSSSSSSNSMNLPFKGLIDAVKKNSSSSVKKLSSSTMALFASCDLSKKSLRQRLARVRSSEDGIDSGYLHRPLTWRNYKYTELACATDNFSHESLLGKGGYAQVYRGSFADGNVVAIKKLMMNPGKKVEDGERVGDFLSELGIVAHVDHPNTAKMIGFGVDRGLFLVLQYCPRGSLASHLHGSREGLEWKIRYKVAVAVAKGLCYLHHGCHRRIIHRDIKASNILLSEDFEPLISDFGLAKWLPDKWLHHVVYPIEGTFGYLAPEYFMHGIANEKTDVFAFGVLLLELLTGRDAVDSSRQSLVMWAKPLLETNNVKELIDPLLGAKYEPDELRRTMLGASMCIHHEPSQRPYMNRVLEVLQGEGCPVDMKQRSMQPRSMLLDACDLENYTCSTYLKDLNRHRQLVME